MVLDTIGDNFDSAPITAPYPYDNLIKLFVEKKYVTSVQFRSQNVLTYTSVHLIQFKNKIITLFPDFLIDAKCKLY